MAIKLYPVAEKFNEKEPYSEVILETPEFAIFHVYVKAGQKVDLHSSKSYMVITVIQGEGKFFVGSEENVEHVKEEETIVYDKGELHGYEAVEDMIVQVNAIPNPLLHQFDED